MNKCFFSQFTQTNQNVKLYIDSNNKYASYGDGNGYSSCTFQNKFALTNVANPVISTTGPAIQFFQSNQIEFTFLVIQPANSLNTSYIFTITEYTNSSLTTDFTLYLLCEELQDSSLVIKILNDKPVQSDFSSYYFYISIKSLKYSLSSLLLTANNNGITAKSTTISKEYYLVEFTTIDIELLIDMPLNFTITFPKKKYTLQTKSIYNSSPIQLISTTLYPSVTTIYTQYGNGFSPVLLVDTNIVNDASYIGWSLTSGETSLSGLLKFIAQTSTSSTFILPLSNIGLASSLKISYDITFNKGSTSDSLTFSFSTQMFPSNQLPVGLLSYSSQFNTVALNFSSSGYQIRNTPLSIQFYDFDAKVQFPYGYISGTNADFTFRSNYIAKISNENSNYNKFKIMEFPNGVSNDYTNPITPIVSDSIPPVVSFFQLKKVNGFKYLMGIGISDNSGFSKMEYTKNQKKVSFGVVGKVGTLESSAQLFEYLVDVKDLINGGLRVYDNYLNELKLNKGSMIYRDSNGYPVYFDIPVPDIDLDIENVILLKNDIDILDKECYNRIYFNSSTIPHDYPLVFSLLDPVSLDDLNEGRIEPLPIVWSDQIKLFYCDFIVPKNTGPKVIKYKISTPFRDITSEALFELRVSSTKYDNDGPLISKIENANTFGKVGWRITIKDKVNGFSKGYIKAIGSKDSSVFKFNFTLADVINQGTKLNGEYDIIIDVKQACASQDYSIEYIYLEDSNKRYSKYSKYESDYLSEKDPLRYLFDQVSSPNNPLISKSTCLIETEDPSPPSLISLVSIGSSDVGSINRYINFTIIAQDDQSGLMLSQTPKVYFTSSEGIFECDTTLLGNTSTDATFKGDCLLPYGFGSSSKELFVSIYGFLNNGGYFSGLTPDSNLLGGSYSVLTTFSATPVLLNYEPVYYHTKTDIVIYGRLIGNTILVIIKYSDGTSRSYTGTLKVIGQSAIIIPKDDFNITGPFDVTAFDSSSKRTNTLRVYPIFFESTNFDPNTITPSLTPTVTPTSTPIPTNKPQRCLGTPECGGINNGYCVENQGCVCYSPWIGNDCLSKVIIIPPPKVNDTVPSVEIPIIDDNNNSSNNNNNNETSTVFYKSLISIISLREISIDGKAVQGKSHNFEKWIFSTIDSNTNQYYTNISTFQVIATLKWFENETDIQFADQNLTMNPSSIKYTIEIKNYPFENDLNTLELVMQASFLSNSTNDSCSSKEFGETSTGDNSNYLKIQIENRSLYGRFIKRCIIDDDKILSLDNKLLDSEMNPISNTKQVQTYIGISIPQFKNNVVLDPDFSVIINPSAASSSSSNSICKNNSSKLSINKIVGIIIGGVAFICAITVAIVYSVYKTKQNSKYMKKVDVKLRNYNNSSTSGN